MIGLSESPLTWTIIAAFDEAIFARHLPVRHHISIRPKKPLGLK